MIIKEEKLRKMVEEGISSINHVGMNDEKIRQDIIDDFVKGIIGNNQIITVKHPFNDIQPLIISTYISIKHNVDNEERRLAREKEDSELAKMSEKDLLCEIVRLLRRIVK